MRREAAWAAVVGVAGVIGAAWAGEGDPGDPAWSVSRVGGDGDRRVEPRGEGWTAGECAVTTPLPAGYPAPTAPGALELKRYPAVRRAEVCGGGDPDRGMNRAFFPLFRHIQRAGIAMTAPVELDLGGEPDGAREDWTMSFLYRTPELGPVGPAADQVEVVDRGPLTVLALGVQGGERQAQLREGEARLDAWLAAQTRWERAGPARVLYYNGPEVPRARRWCEVQVPVRAAAAPKGEPPAGKRWF